ncbi:MAG: phosphoribosylformylglycinamidine synthase subunit PurS [Actinobacteria bacterium]|nr:MAG: phosphoribosylformylglycinamidine synthase subunit PurS [Actinomycetota bacterium]
MAKVNVYVTFKEGILDPQGQIAGKALRQLGYDNVEDVRIGKFIELTLDPRKDLDAEVDEMCRRLLANPIIEDFRYEVIGG